jgi:acyl-CoA thioesterase FadM
MYPFVRMVWQRWRHRLDAPLGWTDVHESRHICLPWDLDFWRELNNGRTLTLYDLGRLPLIDRNGLDRVMRREGWGMAVAGATVRYRRRVKVFDRIAMKSRVICWDRRFLYFEQSMWKSDGECASHAAYRVAITDVAGIVTPDRVLAALGLPDDSPPMPEWVTQWSASEDARPWPPMTDT